MGEAAKKETSMEDILASIRKIITSDEANTKNGETTGQPSDSSSNVKGSDATHPRDEASAASGSAQSAQPGSLAALSAQLKAQIPSKPSTPLNTSQDSSSPEASSSENAVEPMVEAKVETPKDVTPPKSLSELASRVTAQPAAKLEPSKPTTNSEPRLKPDAESRFSGDSLRELASRVAASNSQKPDVPAQQPAGSQSEATAGQVPEASSERTEPENVKRSVPESAPKAEGSTKTAAAADQPTEAKDETAFREALVAPATQSAVTGSMDRLRKAAENVDTAQVEAILRPMLKEWLDANLPSLVENMVQQEISRISGK